ncbi:MAG: substrate-binding domain-containing protein [Fibrobacteres bacterium]|nr:substrate-binding domain-containing protein [Fibrobacterota bacterium]
MKKITTKNGGATGKRAQIREWILEEIRTGRMKSGDFAPTRASLAKSFNCTYATANYVISELMKEKVLVAEQGKGTFVTSRPNRTPVDGYAIINCNPTFFWSLEIEQGFIDAIGKGVRVDRFTAEDIRQPINWEFCKEHKALIFIMPVPSQGSFLHEVKTLNLPHIVLYRDPMESPFITIDHADAGREVVAALAKKGCRRIAWSGLVFHDIKTPEQRYTGYLQGLLEQGLSYKREWGRMIHPSEEQAHLKSLFSDSIKPDALILAPANMGIAIKAVQDAGLKPGEDIILVKMDEDVSGAYPFSILCTGRLTQKVGEEAALAVLKKEHITSENPMRRYLKTAVLER